MGKGRDKRKRKAKKDSQKTRDVPRIVNVHRAISEPSSDPPILGEPDAPVLSPLKPKPHLRSGAVAIPEPKPEDEFVVVGPRVVSKS